jgi:hypothetical protein
VNVAIKDADDAGARRANLERPINNAKAHVTFHRIYHNGEYEQCTQHGPRTTEDMITEAVHNFCDESDRRHESDLRRERLAAMEPEPSSGALESLARFLKELNKLQPDFQREVAIE